MKTLLVYLEVHTGVIMMRKMLTDYVDRATAGAPALRCPIPTCITHVLNYKHTQ